MAFSNLILGITVLFSALMAGLFFSFSCSVMPGLRVITDTNFIPSMQSINRAIQNPVFLVVFMGSLVLLPYTAYIHYNPASMRCFWLLLAGAVLYFGGVFCVTVFGNIPLNDALDKFQLNGASTEAVHQCRLNFEDPWNRLQTVRTVCSVLSVIMLIGACIFKNGER